MRRLAAAAALVALGCAKPAPPPAPTIDGQTLKIERLENGCVAVAREPGPPQLVCEPTPMPDPTK
ncbi:MAG: hypothetical protein JNJ73_10225 [Hyphomonadaceae bacterium]|nr:hypothetical protein [Hyphomonadaceae bacterium]